MPKDEASSELSGSDKDLHTPPTLVEPVQDAGSSPPAGPSHQGTQDWELQSVNSKDTPSPRRSEVSAATVTSWTTQTSGQNADRKKLKKSWTGMSLDKKSLTSSVRKTYDAETRAFLRSATGAQEDWELRSLDSWKSKDPELKRARLTVGSVATRGSDQTRGSAATGISKATVFSTASVARMSSWTTAAFARKTEIDSLPEGAQSAANSVYFGGNGAHKDKHNKDLRSQLISQTLMLDEKAEAQDADSFDHAAMGYLTTDFLLEEALQMSSRHRFWRAILKTLGILALSDAAAAERERRSDPDFVNPFPCTALVVESPFFEICMGILMIVNGVLVGVDASTRGDGDQALEYFLERAEHFFTAVFVLELVLQVVVYGWVWVTDGANLLDILLIVFTGVLPMWILKPAGIESEFVRVLQVLRVLRLVRLINMFRTARWLRMAFKLTQGLLNSGTIILHTYFMMGTCLFVFAVFSVFMVGRSPALDTSVETQREVKDMFHTVPDAMFTLFQWVTLDDWSSTVRRTGGAAAALLVLVVAVFVIMTLVLSNLITAVIVTHALNVIKEDAELIVAEKKSEFEAEMKQLTRVFRVTIGPYKRRMDKETFMHALGKRSDLRLKLAPLQLIKEEEEEIWELLEEAGGGKGTVGEEAFCKTLWRLRGEALAKDSFKSKEILRKVNHKISRLRLRVAQVQGELDHLRSLASQARKQHAKAFTEMTELVTHAAVLIPEEPLTKKPKHFKDFQSMRETWKSVPDEFAPDSPEILEALARRTEREEHANRRTEMQRLAEKDAQGEMNSDSASESSAHSE